MGADLAIAGAGAERFRDRVPRAREIAAPEVRPGAGVVGEDVVAAGRFGKADGFVDVPIVLGEESREPRRLRRIDAPRRFGEAVVTLGLVSATEPGEQIARE